MEKPSDILIELFLIISKLDDIFLKRIISDADIKKAEILFQDGYKAVRKLKNERNTTLQNRSTQG